MFTIANKLFQVRPSPSPSLRRLCRGRSLPPSGRHRGSLVRLEFVRRTSESPPRATRGLPHGGLRAQRFQHLRRRGGNDVQPGQLDQNVENLRPELDARELREPGELALDLVGSQGRHPRCGARSDRGEIQSFQTRDEKERTGASWRADEPFAASSSRRKAALLFAPCFHNTSRTSQVPTTDTKVKMAEPTTVRRPSVTLRRPTARHATSPARRSGPRLGASVEINRAIGPSPAPDSRGSGRDRATWTLESPGDALRTPYIASIDASGRLASPPVHLPPPRPAPDAPPRDDRRPIR